MSTAKNKFLGEIQGGLPFLDRIAKECGAVVVESDPPTHLAPRGMVRARTFMNADGSELTEAQKKHLARSIRDNRVHRFCRNGVEAAS